MAYSGRRPSSLVDWPWLAYFVVQMPLILGEQALGALWQRADLPAPPRLVRCKSRIVAYITL